MTDAAESIVEGIEKLEIKETNTCFRAYKNEKRGVIFPDCEGDLRVADESLFASLEELNIILGLSNSLRNRFPWWKLELCYIDVCLDTGEILHQPVELPDLFDWCYLSFVFLGGCMLRFNYKDHPHLKGDEDMMNTNLIPIINRLTEKMDAHFISKGLTCPEISRSSGPIEFREEKIVELLAYSKGFFLAVHGDSIKRTVFKDCL